MFEKDELNLSLKSLQEEHSKILQQNEVSGWSGSEGPGSTLYRGQKLLLNSSFPKMFAMREVLDLE